MSRTALDFRKLQPYNRVYDRAEENDGDNDPEEDHRAYEAVRGSLSTKMEAVVRTLIKIRTDDPKAKCLVFSTWTDVLDILSSALAENNIAFAALHAQGKFKRNLLKFKVSVRDDVSRRNSRCFLVAALKLG